MSYLHDYDIAAVEISGCLLAPEDLTGGQRSDKRNPLPKTDSNKEQCRKTRPGSGDRVWRSNAIQHCQR